MNALRIAVPAAALALLAGCAGAPPAREPRPPVEEQLAVRVDAPDRPGEVRFDTEPEGADFLMDNRLRGTTPLIMTSLAPGSYKVEVRKPGYVTVVEYVQHPGGGARYTLPLQRLAGRLTLTVAPGAAVINVADGRLEPGSYEMPAGSYRVQASAFGYNGEDRIVRVEPGSEARADLVLEPARFAARVLGPARRRLEAGRLRVDLEVSGPASLVVRVLAAAGDEVYTAAADIGEPRASVTWDGRTRAGAEAAPGSYVVRLELRSQRGETAALQVEVEVAARKSAGLGSQGSGVSGLQYVASPDVEPAGSGMFALSSTLLLQPAATSVVTSAPVILAARHGLGRGLELDAQAGAFLQGDQPLPFLAAAGLKAALPAPAPIRLAATARASLQAGLGSDPFTAFTGAGLGIAIAAAAGPFVLLLEPQLTVSPWRVTGDAAYDDDPALNAWAYLRAGLCVRLAGVGAGLSAAARTEAGRAAWAGPVAVGAEAQWEPRPGRLVLSATAAAAVDSRSVESLLLGASFGYRY